MDALASLEASVPAATPVVPPDDLPSLEMLVDVIRSPGITTTGDVDALLLRLASPAPDETPRQRADLILALLEDSELSELKGRDERSLRAAALEALFALGYPYALEVTPQALERVRAEQPLPPRAFDLFSTIGLGIGAYASYLIFPPDTNPELCDHVHNNTPPHIYNDFAEDSPLFFLPLSPLILAFFTTLAFRYRLPFHRGLTWLGWLLSIPFFLLVLPDYQNNLSDTTAPFLASIAFMISTFLLRPRPELPRGKGASSSKNATEENPKP